MHKGQLLIRGFSEAWYVKVVKITVGIIYYIPVNTTQFPAGGVCYLGRHISVRMCHLQVMFLVTNILQCIWRKFSM
jgi:hypothetical protein